MGLPRRDPTAQELYEFGLSEGAPAWVRLPDEAKAAWERIAKERAVKLEAARRKAGV